MKCIKCGYQKTIVADSREDISRLLTYRRRACPKCQHRYTTYEQKIDVSPGQKKKPWLNEALGVT
jgi:transcriptional regulator NrdR family protein